MSIYRKEKERVRKIAAIVITSIVFVFMGAMYAHYSVINWMQEQSYSHSLFPASLNYKNNKSLIPFKIKSWGDMFIVNDYLDFFKYSLISAESPQLEIEGLRKRISFQSDEQSEIGMNHQWLLNHKVGPIKLDDWNMLKDDYSKMNAIDYSSLKTSKYNPIDGLNEKTENDLINLYEKKNIQAQILFDNENALKAINIYRQNLFNVDFQYLLESSQYKKLWANYFAKDLGEHPSLILKVFDGSIYELPLEKIKEMKVKGL